jgi:hypothetical protein
MILSYFIMDNLDLKSCMIRILLTGREFNSYRYIIFVIKLSVA